MNDILCTVKNLPWHCDPRPTAEIVMNGNDVIGVLIIILLALVVLAVIRRL